MILGFVRKANIFLLQHYLPIRPIHCQIAVSEFPTDFDSWDLLTIIGSRSPIRERCKKSVNFCSFDKGCKPKREEELVLLLYMYFIPMDCHLRNVKMYKNTKILSKYSMRFKSYKRFR